MEISIMLLEQQADLLENTIKELKHPAHNETIQDILNRTKQYRKAANILRMYSNFTNSENADFAVFEVRKALIAFFKWRKGQQLTADTILEIETFAKEYENNL